MYQVWVYKTSQIEHDFTLSGPSHLTTVNWNDERYRRSTMASLVKGVYVLKDDHRQHRQGSEALAPLWWESFHFKLLHGLTDDEDSSIFGAVYEYKPKSNNYLGLIRAPKYVIAFRGTSKNKDTVLEDMSCNMNILLNNLHSTPRFAKAMKVVRKMVSENGASNIWLAGHSLGAAMAMGTGKTMAKEGVFLEAYLFNPPFIAAPIEPIGNRLVRYGLLVACTTITVGLTVFLQSNQEMQQSEDLFTSLSPWIPNLFLHPDDTICSGYIAYFELQEMFKSCGLEIIGRLEAQHSWQGLFMNAIGLENWSEELHLIPSARVTTSSNPKPHKLSQWYTDNSVSVPKVYQY
ncbi:GDSL esterase/lipase At4g10955-like isoform X1 [Papaver somniferum]|uniref:GDSL esterase/lipase At4g10955-like isoform X1 n=1 Tax=Papaver somniferum TaxID=3469 RepID=UPI000E703F7D|nr:GDSL esterase/lipase At4g10955-like isoform X1 [Papaver somniferum]